MAVHVDVNTAAIQEVFLSPSGPAFRHVQNVTERVRNEAVRRAPRDTGALAASTEATVAVYGTSIIGRVGSRLEYAIYVNEGTGIHGPKKRVIRPVSAKVLKFRPSRAHGPFQRGARGNVSPEKRGPYIYAAYVKGSPKNAYLVDALETVLPGRVNVRE